ncbi:hypothetical protein [Campylobacter mucosalis]|uniref:hypothetical protein n=1 Tax=Campylobacter mucosalis TaxID=202 RepID=UPI001470560E|nr:hypothetical protein [Campylobacter mucosalis]
MRALIFLTLQSVILSSFTRNGVSFKICKNNQNTDKSLLLSLTSKLCDRFIFILFAEDRGLLRLKTIAEIEKEFLEQKFALTP